MQDAKKSGDTLLLEVKDAVEAFNDKLCVISTSADIAKEDPAVSPRTSRMLALMVQACREFHTKCQALVKKINERLFRAR